MLNILTAHNFAHHIKYVIVPAATPSPFVLQPHRTKSVAVPPPTPLPTAVHAWSSPSLVTVAVVSYVAVSATMAKESLAMKVSIVKSLSLGNCLDIYLKKGFGSSKPQQWPFPLSRGKDREELEEAGGERCSTFHVGEASLSLILIVIRILYILLIL
nr:hypothetical protein Iba_chr03aCG4260 [Ipomoea batatas]